MASKGQHTQDNNLRPMNTLSKEEKFAIQSKGGRTCAQRKHNYKGMGQWADILGSEFINNGEGDIMERYKAVVLEQFNNAILKGDTRSARFLAEISGALNNGTTVNTTIKTDDITLKID